MQSVSKAHYALLDSGGGRKLEQFGAVTLVRPCAQAVWRPQLASTEWQRLADATFDREDGNQWHNRSAVPESWLIDIDGLKFKLSSTNFGHLGVFPEQREQWRWLGEQLTATQTKCPDQPPAVLNAFAYSGGSTLAAARQRAAVCHLDASKGMVQWARENAQLNGLASHPIRWITDDAHTFMRREVRRGRHYEGIILDPPTFGRGQNGELYKIEEHLPETLALCRELLSARPRFVLLSAHTPGYSPTILGNILQQALAGLPGEIECGEMLLTGAQDVMPLPSGAYARWHSVL